MSIRHEGNNAPTVRPAAVREWTTWAGVALILLLGLIHAVDAPDNFSEAAYKGLLFVAIGLGAALAAFGIYRGRSWGWHLGALVAVGAFVGYVISRTVGLPGLDVDDAWFEPLGVLSIITEALFVGLYWLTHATKDT